MHVFFLPLRWKIMMIILVLSMLTLAIYWQVQRFNFINYDDNMYVTQNNHVKSGINLQSVFSSFTDIKTANWHPLTMLSHMLDWQLFGNKAGGHHWTSVIIHILNTILLFLLLNRLTGALWRSALVAALFAVHPINVESVAWVAERKNVLSTFFWFLTMLFYVWYAEKPGWKRYLPVILCFALGLMSKPMLVTLPFALLLMDYWPFNRTEIDTSYNEDRQSVQVRKAGWKFLIAEKIPLFVLTGIFSAITMHAQQSVGAVVSIDSLPFHLRVQNAIASYGIYIQKMFWPLDLSVFYPRYNIAGWELLMILLFLVFLSLLIIRYYQKKPYLLVGWLWFLGIMVPVIGFVQVGDQAMADRYAYVPFIGLFVMVVWYSYDCVSQNKYLRAGFIIFSFCVVLFLSVICWQYCQLWGNKFALWNNVLKHHKVAFAYNFRGLAYAEEGRNNLALADYNTAIELEKKFVEAFINRAILYTGMSEYSRALIDFNHAQSINPRFADIYYNRGLLYLKTGQLDAAIADFTETIRIEPEMADAYNNRGLALHLKGDYKKAFADLNRALKINPQLAEAYFNRGIIYNTSGQYINAISDFTTTLDIKPQFAEAYLYRGVSFAFLGRYNDAIGDFQQVISIDTRHVPGRNNLGNLLKKMKRYEEASEQYRKVLQIKPDDQDALRSLREIEILKKGKS